MLAILGAAAIMTSLLVATRPVLAGADTAGNIAIFKTLCDNIGQQDTCNGRDTSLEGYKIDYSVQPVVDDVPEASVQTITVTLGDNAGEGGNTGDGSQGRAEGATLPAGTYLVCEVPDGAPIAYKDGEPDVVLDAVPRPDAGGGGSTGGNQQQVGDCIQSDLGSGTEELKFLDRRLEQPEPPTQTLVIDKVADAEVIEIADDVATPSIVTWTLTYTLTNGPVHNAVIEDDVPAGFTFLDATDGGTEAGGTVT